MQTLFFSPCLSLQALERHYWAPVFTLQKEATQAARLAGVTDPTLFYTKSPTRGHGVVPSFTVSLQLYHRN